MKKENLSFLKKIGYMLFSLCLIIASLFFAVSFSTKNNKEIKNIDISKGWSATIENKKINNIDLHNYYCENYGEKRDVIISYKFKKDYNILFPTIILKTDNYLKEVYLDNKKIDVDINADKEAIKQYYTIKLPDDYKGKKIDIKLEIKNSEEDQLINSVNFTSENDYILYKLRENKVPFIVGLGMGILGILLILITIVVTIDTQRIKKLFWTGFTFICGGMSMIGYYGILELIINSNRFIKNVIFTGMFFCIPGVLMIAYNTFKNKKYKKIMYIYNISLYLIYILIRFLYNINTLSYDSVLLVTKCFMLITAVLLLIYNVASYVKVNVMEKIYTVGISLCYIIGIALIIISFTDDLFMKKSIGCNCLIVLVFCLFLITIIYYAYVADGYLNRVTEKRILSTLAYTDSLTGIYNRTKFEEFLNDLENKDIDNICIYSFDLNNLKKINDKYGHDMGDVYIKSFGESINKVFGNLGFAARIGGDEFIVILENKSVETDNVYKKLNNCFKELMKGCKVEYKASFAFGTAYNKDEKLTIKELIDLADKRMYENKKQVKEV